MNNQHRAVVANRAIGTRIRVAREAASLSQQAVADRLQWADRQTLSAVENGDRRVQAEELVRIAELFERPIDWFLDPFVVEGEADFSWRVSREVTDPILTEFEGRAGQIVGLYRHLKTAMGGDASPLAYVLKVPDNAAFEVAWSLGERVGSLMDLGPIPAANLASRIESKFNIPVLFLDAPMGPMPGDHGISGAMCRLPDLGVILINRLEPLARRHYDMAHELFHALTWDAMRPEHREDSSATPKSNANRRVESLADNFASALLMPRAILKEMIAPERYGDVEHLVKVAHTLQVSTMALAHRLFNIKLIDKATQKALCEPHKSHQPDKPKLFSASFVDLLHQGLTRGHVSSRKVAKALGKNLDELAKLLQDYSKPVPFEL